MQQINVVHGQKGPALASMIGDKRKYQNITVGAALQQAHSELQLSKPDGKGFLFTEAMHDGKASTEQRQHLRQRCLQAAHANLQLSMNNKPSQEAASSRQRLGIFQ
jgi:hypothetical protein